MYTHTQDYVTSSGTRVTGEIMGPGTELWSFKRAASALNHWDIPPPALGDFNQI